MTGRSSTPSSAPLLDELVGDDGEVLEALQELTRLAVHRKTGTRARLMLDVGGFRVRRRAELAHLGRSVAAEVARTGEPKKLRAMSPFERKIIHDAVAVAGLRSESEGEEPNRRVVVFPAGWGPLLTADQLDPPLPSAEAIAEFGDSLAKAQRYVELLATDGVTRGLIGPRETSRLWDRHLLNCALVAELVPDAGRTRRHRLGRGAAGLVLAMLRPWLHVVLLEPLLRRSVFLEECVRALDLPNATVLRAPGRGEVGGEDQGGCGDGPGGGAARSARRLGSGPAAPGR